ncbi:RlpA-like double-psi beta-barrel domain containing protein [Trema orientale]|uniref:RlpA-like double-psi beta-barrel domain containing protein n=1 Tax=Trema orientale TaxID=63057 RepID=A0A2P5F2M9_TREOI|nr:RlpA-like double-psi beta-barrel domain containing protein [Trema orientale]
MKGSNISKKNSTSSSIFFLVGLAILFLTLFTTCHVEASKCRPSGRVRGKRPPSGQCSIEQDDICCLEGKMYKVYKCSPPVTRHTKAYMTLNSFQGGGDGGSPSKCNNYYHSDDTMVVALSTGWYKGGSRCLKNVTITAPSGRSVVAMVVDECDSSVGCDAEHDYQPPCANNIVGASLAVWKALGVGREDWGGLDITWSDSS